MSHPLTVLFVPESAYGPTNQCIGLGDILARRGHRVIFAAEASWRGRLIPHGFEEALVDLAPPEEESAPEPDQAGSFWTDFIAQTAPEFRKPTLEQLASFIRPTYQALIDGAIYCEPRLKEIIDQYQPDVIVEDNVIAFPALVTAPAPFIRIVSCNPLEVRGERVAPVFAGYPADDPSGWPEFRAEFDRTHRSMWNQFNDWVLRQGAPALPELEFIHTSDALNIYVYPKEADYTAERPLGRNWLRIDSSVRETDEEYEVPESVRERTPGAGLVYLSLGSLGGADVELMQRLVDVLAKTPHRYIVSMGPRAEHITLADNMVGAPTLPQTKVIPQVDMVITHGGNNTTTEALHFGKPMLILPLFWDQYDNAQRIHELGFGRRLPAYTFEDADLVDAIDALLGDRSLRMRMAAMGAAIRSRNGLRAGADAIEKVARDHANGVRQR